MEDAVARFPFGHGSMILRQTLLCATQEMKGGDEIRFPLLITGLDRLAQSLGFDQDAGAGDVLEVRQGDGSDAKPPLTLYQHEGIGDQAQ